MSSVIHAIIATLRPRHWVKNLFIFAALIFVRAFTDWRLTALAFQAFALFCLTASAVYIFNDLVDLSSDREHPARRLRPLASGRVSRGAAAATGVLLLVASVAGAWYIGRNLLLVILGYFALNFFYTLWLKHIVIVDVLCIAVGFVLRVIAGAVAINVKFSPWLIFCTFFLTLFLAIGKRRSELLLDSGQRQARSVLSAYSLAFIDQMNMIVLPLTLTTYTFYTFSSEHSRLLMLTVPVVLYGLLRYLFILNQKISPDDGPTDDLLKDRPLQTAIIIWLVMSVVVIWYRG